MSVISLLLWFTQGGSCAGCSVDGAKVVLCGVHAADERTVLAREGVRVRSGDEAEALAAMDAIAALTLAHPDAPSPQVVETIAEGLSSTQSPKVRARAVELLGPPQHARASLDVLLPAFVQTDRDASGIIDEEMAADMRGYLALLDVTLGLLDGTGVPKADRQKFEKAKKEAKELRETLAKATPNLEVRSALLHRLAGFADDRVVGAILRSTSALSFEGIDALLLLGNRPAIEHVLKVLKAWQEAPRTGEEKLVERFETRCRRLQEKLRDLAIRKGLVPCPDAGGTPYEAWMRWWRSNRSAFPERLQGVTSARLDSGETAPR